MARYKERSQENLMVAINLSEQLLAGTFESALDDLVEHHLDLSAFDALYRNDHCGQAAYHPKVLLKIILFGYSKGILSSRALERACKENTIFMALSGDKAPDHSTIAHFVTDHGERVKALFLEVLSICNECGLIGFEYFAVDGHKLPSNASKEYSGTVTELKKRQAKLKEKLDRCMSEHARADTEGEEKNRAEAQRENLAKEIARYERFLSGAEPKKGKTGRELQTNLTDPESAKLQNQRRLCARVQWNGGS